MEFDVGALSTAYFITDKYVLLCPYGYRLRVLSQTLGKIRVRLVAV